MTSIPKRVVGSSSSEVMSLLGAPCSGGLVNRAAMNFHLDGPDGDRVAGVFAQRLEVIGIAGQDQSARTGARDRRNNRVDRRDGPGAPGGTAKAARFSGLGLVNIPDLTRPEEPVDVVVTTMIAGQCFGKDDRGYLSRPQTPALQLLEARPLFGQ